MRYKSKDYSSEYDAINNAVHRCRNPDSIQWQNYGGRGIEVCQEWRDDRESFVRYMGAKPTPDYTLDRIDNDKGYAPGNVRWATRETQIGNRRPRRASAFCGLDVVEYQGERRTWEEWADHLGLQVSCLRQRRARNPDLDSVLAPRRRQRVRRVEINGESVSLQDVAAEVGLSYDRVASLNLRGYSPEQIAAGDYAKTKRDYAGARPWTYEGVSYSITTMSRTFNVSPNLLGKRLHSGWPVDLAITVPPNAMWRDADGQFHPRAAYRRLLEEQARIEGGPSEERTVGVDSPLNR